MKPRDRVLAALEHRSFDRLPIKHLAVSEIDRMLYRHFGVGEENALLDILGHDFREIRPRYCGPPMNRLDSEHGIISGVVMARAMQEHRPGVALPLADIVDIAQLDQFSYPIYDWYDYASVAEQCREYDDYALQLGYCEGDFINGLSGLRGQEQVLMDIASTEPVFVELVERRFQVVLEHLRRGIESGGGRIDILHLGDDFGSQKGLLISPRSFERLFAQEYRGLVCFGAPPRRPHHDAYLRERRGPDPAAHRDRARHPGRRADQRRRHGPAHAQGAVWRPPGFCRHDVCPGGSAFCQHRTRAGRSSEAT